MDKERNFKADMPCPPEMRDRQEPFDFNFDPKRISFDNRRNDFNDPRPPMPPQPMPDNKNINPPPQGQGNFQNNPPPPMPPKDNRNM